MRPMKPRPAGGPHQAFIDAANEIGAKEKRPTQGYEIIANFLGKSPWTVTEWGDPTKDGEIDFVRLHQIAAKWQVEALARHFASLAHGVFIPLAVSPLDSKWAELTSDAVEDMGRLLAEIVRDLAVDGKIDKAEAARCLLIQNDVMRHMAQLHAMLRAVADGGAI